MARGAGGGQPNQRLAIAPCTTTARREHPSARFALHPARFRLYLSRPIAPAPVECVKHTMLDQPLNSKESVQQPETRVSVGEPSK